VAARQVRAVAQRSVWSRRQRSAGWFVLGYVGLWAAVGAGLVALVVGTGLGSASDLLVVSLLLAAAWQTSAPRRRLVRRCEALKLGPPSGRAGDLDCARLGVRAGVRCLQECWPAMIAMAVSQSLVLMMGLTVVLLTERTRGANPQRRGGRPLEAWVLAGFAGVALVVALT
jgi:predicted metal-binding membrane protein